MVFCRMRRNGTFGLAIFRNHRITGASYHRPLQYMVFLFQFGERVISRCSIQGIDWEWDLLVTASIRTLELVSRAPYNRTAKIKDPRFF